ncbi:hypothetical protein HJC23_012426 [Cyclotella cryptica]|uniref:Uncharacterized protein n=1 Tax=Cyclotella cryptica TaxID=29204 RepID=A0ABD3Q466_9STRA|eukprot:CCRYP_009396-RA/>CCRYP_009396-RA protein AED:0.11 eAED:0.11 QI:0/-1/0/1/-1/1/1/0/554
MYCLRIKKKTLEQIRKLDPQYDAVALCPRDIKNAHVVGHLGEIGRCIGENTSINHLTISKFNYYDSEHELDRDCPLSGVSAREFEIFFDGVSRSQSIKEIRCNNCCLGGHILKLFDMSNIEKVVFNDCVITRHTASAMRAVSHLRRIVLERMMKDCIFFDDDSQADFFASLNHNFKLESLALNWFWIKNGNYNSLATILSDPQSIINEIELFMCDEYNVGALSGLRNGLMNSTSLRVLYINGCPDNLEGWQLISDILSSPGASLKVLHLNGGVYDCEYAVSLGRGLAHNTTLEELKFYFYGTCQEAGWLAITSAILTSPFPLKLMDIRGNENINDDVISSLAEVLIEKKNTIKEVNLGRFPEVTSTGWSVLYSAFLAPMPNLTEVYIGNESFAGINMDPFWNGLCNKPSLRVLILSWAHLSTVGWDAFSKVLCDNSSLHAIQHSNHTLRQILGEFRDRSTIPDNVDNLLEMNRSGNASDVARLKVIQFYSGINIESVVNDQHEMQTKLVPSVISWLGKDPSTHITLHHFVRNQASLFDIRSRQASKEATPDFGV